MTDLISRQALCEYALNQKDKSITPNEIMRFPPAYPKKGKWIYTRYYTWECSECKKNPTSGMGYVQRKDELFEFCPNCGAKMREEPCKK